MPRGQDGVAETHILRPLLLREKRLSNGLVGLNYHRWRICDGAVKKGRELHLPLYRFLKEPLIRRFGEAWYEELEAVAKEFSSCIR